MNTYEAGPYKFAPGDRVEPTPEAIALLWIKHGEVVECGVFTVEVIMDGEVTSHPYRIEMWEAEEQPQLSPSAPEIEDHK